MEAVSAADVEFVRERVELFFRNERDAAMARWAEDCISIPPAQWPESERAEGRDAVRAVFDGFDEAFGHDWPTQMEISRIEDAGDGQVLLEFAWNPSGISSGIPLDQAITAVYTVRDGKIAKGEFFMSYEEGRKAAGLA